MARKKRKSGGKSSSRGKRVGRAGDKAIPTALGVAGGVIASRFIKNFAAKQFPTTDKTILAAAPAIVGAVVVMNPFKMKFLEDPIVQGVGMGLVGGGITNVLIEMDVIGDATPPLILRKRIAGNPGNIPVIGQSQYPYNNVPVIGANPGNPGSVPVIGRASNRTRRATATF